MHQINFWKLSTVILILVVIIISGWFYFEKNGSSEFEEIKQIVQKKIDYRDRNPTLSKDNNDYFYSIPTQIVFEKDLYDFDTIEEGTVIQKDLFYNNSGTNPYFLLDVKVSCGCTVPKYETEPIAPKSKGKISVGFDSKGKSGFSMNKLTLFGNVEGGETSIYFKVFVKPKK
jgi:hypothetical protein